jgi:hypothetical protein
MARNSQGPRITCSYSQRFEKIGKYPRRSEYRERCERERVESVYRCWKVLFQYHITFIKSYKRILRCMRPLFIVHEEQKIHLTKEMVGQLARGLERTADPGYESGEEGILKWKVTI